MTIFQLFIYFDKNNENLKVDGLCSVRSDNENDTTLLIKNELLVQMQSGGTSNDGVLVLGATNRPWAIDNAFMRYGLT